MNNTATPFRLPTPAFWPGQIVYHRADGSRGLVTSITFTRKDITYGAAFGPEVSGTYFSEELTADKPLDGVEESVD